MINAALCTCAKQFSVYAIARLLSKRMTAWWLLRNGECNVLKDIFVMCCWRLRSVVLTSNLLHICYIFFLFLLVYFYVCRVRGLVLPMCMAAFDKFGCVQLLDCFAIYWDCSYVCLGCYLCALTLDVRLAATYAHWLHIPGKADQWYVGSGWLEGQLLYTP